MRTLMVVACVCALAFPAMAADPPKPVKKKRKRELAGELVELQTSDGWTLKGRYLESDYDDQLTFILLHEARGRRQNWYWLARRMAKRGIGYLAIDLRGHGQSRNPPEGQTAVWRKFTVSKRYNEWDNMRQDIGAAARFLLEREVPEESIAVGGANVGGSLALKYAALHPAVPMVFLLSPGMSYREVLTVNAMRAFRDRPILMVVAEEDRKSSTETQILHAFAMRAAGEENVTLMRVERRHGTAMLYFNKGLIADVLDWMDNPIQAPDLGVSTDTFSGAVEGVESSGGEGGADGSSESGDLPNDEALDRIMDGTAD